MNLDLDFTGVVPNNFHRSPGRRTDSGPHDPHIVWGKDPQKGSSEVSPKESRGHKTVYTKTGCLMSSWDPIINRDLWGHRNGLRAIGLDLGPLEWTGGNWNGLGPTQHMHSNCDFCYDLVLQKSLKTCMFVNNGRPCVQHDQT